jgi:CRP-like cAMP-binding protein
VEEEGGNILGPGDFFGVVSTMSSHSHIETARALTDVTLISVQKEQFGRLIQNNTPVAMKIILQFSQRLRYLDVALSRLTLKNAADAEASPAHLYHVGQYYVRQSQYNQAYYALCQYVKYCPDGENAPLAREMMAKIAPYARDVTTEHKSDEFNRTYPKNTMLFSEGESGDELYIIQKGSVKIVKIMDGKEVLLAVLKAGDIFGEMALLEAKPRAASAVAYEDCVVLAVNRANFERMITSQPQIIARLTILLSERIWLIYKQLTNTLITDPVGRMYDALQVQLEKNRAELDNTGSYTFDFGPKELADMVGIPPADQPLVLRKFLEDKKMQIVHDKVMTLDISEIPKQTEFHKKMQRIEKARHDGRIAG